MIRKPTDDDIQDLIDNIRPEDKVEIEALSEYSLEDTIRASIQMQADAKAWVVEGKVACVYGVVPHQDSDKTGVIWMIATDIFDENRTTFARGCKKVFEEMIKGYDYLFNYIHSANHVSIEWLQWLGFTICEPEQIGRQGETFYRFEMINV